MYCDKSDEVSFAFYFSFTLKGFYRRVVSASDFGEEMLKVSRLRGSRLENPITSLGLGLSCT